MLAMTKITEKIKSMFQHLTEIFERKNKSSNELYHEKFKPLFNHENQHLQGTKCSKISFLTLRLTNKLGYGQELPIASNFKKNVD